MKGNNGSQIVVFLLKQLGKECDKPSQFGIGNTERRFP